MQKTVWKRMLVTLRVVTDPASSSANPACITRVGDMRDLPPACQRFEAAYG